MCKLRTGPPISVIKCSNGADNNKLNFYSTSYSSYYGKEGFVSRAPKPKGTGYFANFRPGVYYASTIDDLDNVEVGKLIRDNYDTSYCKQHRLYYSGSDGKDKLPLRIMRNESGFTQKAPITTADTKVVRQAREFTMDDGKHRPLLHRLQNKRVPHLDRGSMNLTTETSVCYKGKPSQRMITHLKDVGTMEPSGFTHYHHFDPIQYLHRAPYGNERYNRPTEISQHQAKFLNWPTMKGSEMNRGVCRRAQRDNGYSYETARPRFVNRIPDDSFTKLNQVPRPVARRINKQDPCEFVNMTKGADNTTLSKAWFQGEQSPRGGTNEHGAVGRKESSGFSANNDRYVEVKDNKRRYTTHYDVKYRQILQPGLYKGWADTTDNRKPTNGFTKSTVVHVYGDGKNFREDQFASFNPLVAKVIKHDNPCYVDNTRSLKLRSETDAS